MSSSTSPSSCSKTLPHSSGNFSPLLLEFIDKYFTDHYPLTHQTLLKAHVPLWVPSGSGRGTSQRLLSQCSQYFSLACFLLQKLTSLSHNFFTSWNECSTCMDVHEYLVLLIRNGTRSMWDLSLSDAGRRRGMATKFCRWRVCDCS